MSPSRQARLWYAQRISAMVLALCVLAHLVTIVLAMKGGLTAAEVLARTRGSWLAAAFYGVFVLSAAVHAPIGVAKILEEHLGWRGRGIVVFMHVFGLALLVLGLAAVWGVVRGAG